MHVFRFLLVSAFCLAATLVQAAGFRLVTVPAEAGSPTLRAAVWPPCDEPVGEVKLRSMTLAATRLFIASSVWRPIVTSLSRWK